jgi:sugar phosphate isomerase/epimerase
LTDQSVKSFLGYSECSSQLKPLAATEKCFAGGLAVLQLAGDYPINFPENVSRAERKQLNRYLKANKIRLHLHAPHDIPLASRHEAVRKGGIARLKEYAQLAIDVGAKTLVIHPGRFAIYKISTGKLALTQRNIPKPYIENFYDSISRLVKYAHDRIQILLENTYGFPPELVEFVDKFLKQKGSGLVWDIGHNASYQKADREKAASFISERIKFVKLIHFHDIDKTRGHLPLGSGNLNIATYLDIIGELKADVIIEVLSDEDLKSSLEFIDSLSSAKVTG